LVANYVVDIKQQGCSFAAEPENGVSFCIISDTSSSSSVGGSVCSPSALSTPSPLILLLPLPHHVVFINNLR
jgi:hypothetical protein